MRSKHRYVGAFAAACLLWATACSDAPPCVCPEAKPKVVALAASGGGLPGAALLRMNHAEAQLALEVATRLFSGRAADVAKRFTPRLAAQLAPERLAKIVIGVTTAHGPPTQVLDAWFSEVTEEGKKLPAAHVLLRMANDVRFRLLLILTSDQRVDGLWLRPI